MTARPLVGVSCCERFLPFGDYPPLAHHVVFGKYVEYVARRIEATPLLIPALPEIPEDPSALAALADSLDGLVLTGSPSNVAVRCGAGGDAPVEVVGFTDHSRDTVAIALVRAALSHGLPLLGICRGMQEINVAMGGDLHQRLHTQAGFRDHRSDKSRCWYQRYEHAHDVEVSRGSRLDVMLEARGVRQRHFAVNSLHGQGISRLGDDIVVEVTADDGVAEAISVAGSRAFAFGVQWHIEWHRDEWDLDSCISEGFRSACRLRHDSRLPARRMQTE